MNIIEASGLGKRYSSAWALRENAEVARLIALLRGLLRALSAGMRQGGLPDTVTGSRSWRVES